MSKLPGHKNGGKLFKKLMKREEDREEAKRQKRLAGTKKKMLKGNKEFARVPK